MGVIKNPYREYKNKKLEQKIKRLFEKHGIKYLHLSVFGNCDFQCIFSEESLTPEQEEVVTKLMKKLFPKNNWGFTDVLAKKENK